MASSVPEDANSVEDADSDTETTISSTSGFQNGGSVSSDRAPDKYGFTGGSQYTHPDVNPHMPVEVLRKRELKWLDMLENWDKYMTKKYKKVRERCRKGIPAALRARAWLFLCGGQFLMDQNKHKFYELQNQPGDPHWVDDIQKDLHRQFPFHEMFMNKGHGQEDLFKVLKAYTILNPVDGYCQAQAPIAAILLMHMPAEQAFWCLVAICDKYLPGYYSHGLEAIQLDGEILFGLLKKVSPQAYKILKKQSIEPVLYMTEWFMCVFTRTLPWASVLRVWDMFFCEGVKVIFRVGLVLLKCALSTSEAAKRCTTIYDTLEVLRGITSMYVQEDSMIQMCLRLNITEYDMEHEHQKQIAKRRALKEQRKMQSANGTTSSRKPKSGAKGSGGGS